MLYFTNQELTATYRVALNTVLNWIKASQQDRLDLELIAKGDRFYVANTAKNIQTLETLVTARKKYRNSRSAKLVTPTPEFYELFNDQQILDVVSNLDFSHEIPRKYNYFDGGAAHWDTYANRLAEEEAPNIVNRTIQLLAANQGYLENLLVSYKRVNVVDVGAGNALPVKQLLGWLVEKKLLGRYVALDISPNMLEIAHKNVEDWFGGRVAFEGHTIDIEQDRFGQLLAGEYLQDDAQDSINLVLFLGGTLGNVRSSDDPLGVIRNSMGRRDLLIHSQKLDSTRTRSFFDFTTYTKNNELAPMHRVLFDVIGLTPDLYEVDMGYDPVKKQRYIRAKLEASIEFKFKIGNGERSVHFDKGESILVLRVWHRNLLDVYELLTHNRFYPLHLSQTTDKEYLLAVSRVDSEFPS
jgi:uncharacterized SAM-dependent methyltransferase